MAASKKYTVSDDQLEDLIARKINERENPGVHPAAHCFGCYDWTTSRHSDGDPYCTACQQEGYAGTPQLDFCLWRKLGAKKGQSFPAELAQRLAQVKRCVPRDLLALDVEELAQTYDELMRTHGEMLHRPPTPREQQEATQRVEDAKAAARLRTVKSQLKAADDQLAQLAIRKETLQQELEELQA